MSCGNGDEPASPWRTLEDTGVAKGDQPGEGFGCAPWRNACVPLKGCVANKLCDVAKVPEDIMLNVEGALPENEQALCVGTGCFEDEGASENGTVDEDSEMGAACFAADGASEIETLAKELELLGCWLGLLGVCIPIV